MQKRLCLTIVYKQDNTKSVAKMKHIHNSPFLPERKKFAKHNECRKGVDKKEQSEALTNEVRNRELWDFSARAFSGINSLCKILKNLTFLHRSLQKYFLKYRLELFHLLFLQGKIRHLLNPEQLRPL